MESEQTRLQTADSVLFPLSLFRLGQQPNFSIDRFERKLADASSGGRRAYVLRQLLSEWTGLPLSREEAKQAWREVERLLPALRSGLHDPVSLQTILLHYFHSLLGVLTRPRLIAEKELVALRDGAFTDPLTGLYNRRFLIEHATRELSRAAREKTVLSLLVMDVKRFKMVNDRFGHPTGDRVLLSIAHAIRQSLRASDIGCRWGGDEFVLILPNTDLISAFVVAERVRRKVAATALPAKADLVIDVHYGIASFPTDGKGFESLLTVADRRLYESREGSAREAGDRRHYPRFGFDNANLLLSSAGPGDIWTVPVVDISYGGLSVRLQKSRELPRIWKAEVFQSEDPRRHPIEIEATYAAPLSDGTVRLGGSLVRSREKKATKRRSR